MENRNDVSVPEDETTLAWNTFCIDRVCQTLHWIDGEHYQMRQVFVEFREVYNRDRLTFRPLMTWLVRYEEALEHFFHSLAQLEFLVSDNEQFIVTNNPCELPIEVLNILKYLGIHLSGTEGLINQNVRGCELLKTVTMQYIERQVYSVRLAQQDLEKLRDGWLNDLDRCVDKTNRSLNLYVV